MNTETLGPVFQQVCIATYRSHFDYANVQNVMIGPYQRTGQK